VKGQKKEILTRLESQHLNRPDIFYFLPIAHFLKQLPTHIAHIAKAPQRYDQSFVKELAKPTRREKLL